MILMLFFTTGVVKSLAQNASDINQKINELKALENIVDEKAARLKTQENNIIAQKKKLIQNQNGLKQQLGSLNSQIAAKQKELADLQKNIVNIKVQKLATIYAQAKSDAAALELSNMDPKIAALILTYMQSRQAGAIISKMDPKTAASIFSLYLESKHHQ